MSAPITALPVETTSIIEQLSSAGVGGLELTDRLPAQKAGGQNFSPSVADILNLASYSAFTRNILSPVNFTLDANCEWVGNRVHSTNPTFVLSSVSYQQRGAFAGLPVSFTLSSPINVVAGTAINLELNCIHGIFSAEHTLLFDGGSMYDNVVHIDVPVEFTLDIDVNYTITVTVSSPNSPFDIETFIDVITA